MGWEMIIQLLSTYHTRNQCLVSQRMPRSRGTNPKKITRRTMSRAAWVRAWMPPPKSLVSALHIWHRRRTIKIAWPINKSTLQKQATHKLNNSLTHTRTHTHTHTHTGIVAPAPQKSDIDTDTAELITQKLEVRTHAHAYDIYVYFFLKRASYVCVECIFSAYCWINTCTTFISHV